MWRLLLFDSRHVIAISPYHIIFIYIQPTTYNHIASYLFLYTFFFLLCLLLFILSFCRKKRKRKDPTRIMEKKRGREREAKQIKENINEMEIQFEINKH